jgi:hypothetical protein
MFKGVKNTFKSWRLCRLKPKLFYSQMADGVTSYMLYLYYYSDTSNGNQGPAQYCGQCGNNVTSFIS